MKKSRELEIMLSEISGVILLDDSLVSAVKRGLLKIRRERHEQYVERKQAFKASAARKRSKDATKTTTPRKEKVE